MRILFPGSSLPLRPPPSKRNVGRVYSGLNDAALFDLHEAPWTSLISDNYIDRNDNYIDRVFPLARW